MVVYFFTDSLNPIISSFCDTLLFEKINIFFLNSNSFHYKFCKFFSHTKTGSDIIIGDDVAIAMGVTLTTHTHQISSGKRRAERKTVFRPIVIGDGCWIGANVTILPGVTIGRGTVVGAGSVVVKDLDANSVYVGNPARKIRQLEG